MTRSVLALALAVAALASASLAPAQESTPAAEFARGVDADALDELDRARDAYGEAAKSAGALAAHARLRLIWAHVVAGDGAAPRALTAEGVAAELAQDRVLARAAREAATASGDQLLAAMAARVEGVVELASVMRELEAAAASEAAAAEVRRALEQRVDDAQVRLRAAETSSDAVARATGQEDLRAALLALEEQCRRDLAALGEERSTSAWRVARLAAVVRVRDVVARRLEAGAPLADEVRAWDAAREAARGAVGWGGLAKALSALLADTPRRAAWPHAAGYRAALEDLGFARDELEKRLRLAEATWDQGERLRVLTTLTAQGVEAARELLPAGVLRQGGELVQALESARAGWRAISSDRDRGIVRDLLEVQSRRATLAPPPGAR